jgi:hypothetical protein
MAKRVFFSFHYQNVADFRVNVIRNHWLTKSDREAAGFFDASVWEKAMKESDLALKRMINSAIGNTSNTCVLIGEGTYNRRWVRYEIFKSLASGNHLFAIHLNKIKDRFQQTLNYGLNPFDYVGYKYSEDGKKLTPIELIDGKWSASQDYPTYNLKSQVSEAMRGKAFKISKDYKTYCWVNDDGYNNFSKWVK